MKRKMKKRVLRKVLKRAWAKIRSYRRSLREARAFQAHQEAGFNETLETHEGEFDRLADTIRDLREQLAKPREQIFQELSRKAESAEGMYRGWEKKALELTESLVASREIADGLLKKGVEQKQEIEKLRGYVDEWAADRDEWRKRAESRAQPFDSQAEDKLRRERDEARTDRDVWKAKVETQHNDELCDRRMTIEQSKCDLVLALDRMTKDRDEWKAARERAERVLERVTKDRDSWREKFADLDSRAVIVGSPTPKAKAEAEALLAGIRAQEQKEDQGPYADAFRTLCGSAAQVLCDKCGSPLDAKDLQDGRTVHDGCRTKSAVGGDGKVTGPLRTGHGGIETPKAARLGQCSQCKVAIDLDMAEDGICGVCAKLYENPIPSPKRGG